MTSKKDSSSAPIWGLICGLAISTLTCITTLAQAQQLEPNESEDLFDLPIEALMDVEVTSASKKAESIYDAPAVMSVVTREEIDAYGDRNLLQLLRRQPSIYNGGYNSFAYPDNHASFRGDLLAHSETHTLVLLNGRPVRESAQGHNFPLYDSFPLSVLDSVELIRGPGSVLYGTNAFTGVINLRTPHIPDKNDITLSGMMGSYDYYQSEAAVRGRSGDFGYITALRFAGQQGYPFRMTDSLGVRGEDNVHARSASAVAHLAYRQLSLDIFASDMDLFQMGVMPFWFVPQHELRNKRLFTNIGYRIPIGDRASLELNGTCNIQENSLSSPAITRIGNNSADLLGEVTFYVNPFNNFNVVAGFLQEYRRTYKPDNDEFQSIATYKYHPRAIYAQGDYKIGDVVKLIAGTQWNETSQGDKDLVSRYGIIITPVENWGVKLLRGEAFRGAIAMESDLADPLLTGNRNLKPETITTYDAQLFYHDEKTYAAFTYFHSVLESQILFDTPPITYINGMGKQRYDGIELEAKRILTPNWHVIGSFSHQANKTALGLDPTVVPKNMFKMGTAYTWDWGSASLFYTLFGKPPQTYFSSVPTLMVNPAPKRINLIDLNIDIDPSKFLGLAKKQATLTLRIENLLNEKVYVPALAYSGSPNSFPYGPGRMWFLGLKITF
jgi:outer membrane receptor protein involved in Fe transport